MYSVTGLLRNAEEILATAESAGADGCGFSIVVKHDGAIHMIADADWSIDSLCAHHGAAAAYRVWRGPAGVRVEARDATDRIVFVTSRPERVLQPVVTDFPRYVLTAAKALPEFGCELMPN